MVDKHSAEVKQWVHQGKMIKKIWIALLVLSMMYVWKNPQNHWMYYFVHPDKLAYYYFNSEDYKNAARHFTKPLDIANAYYLNGEFKKSISHYQKVSNEVGKFNLGNAYVYSGQYDKAVKSYEQALIYNPDSQMIQNNLAIARMKVKELEAKAGEGSGKLGADDIVFDKENKLNFDEAGQETVMSELDIRDQKKAWLKQVNTTPEVFLKNKFLLQESQMQDIHQGEG